MKKMKIRSTEPQADCKKRAKDEQEVADEHADKHQRMRIADSDSEQDISDEEFPSYEGLDTVGKAAKFFDISKDEAPSSMPGSSTDEPGNHKVAALILKFESMAAGTAANCISSQAVD